MSPGPAVARHVAQTPRADHALSPARSGSRSPASRCSSSRITPTAGNISAGSSPRSAPTSWSAEHGQQALYLLEEARPHAILLDILMPVMDGFTFVERMTGEPRWARIPVIAVTALGSGRDIVRTREAGFAGHLTKPIEEADLLTVIQRILAGHRRGSRESRSPSPRRPPSS